MESIIEAVARCRQLRNQQQLVEALECLDAVLARAPFFAPCYLDRASLLGELGRFEEALLECEKYLAYAPPSPDIEAFRDQLRDSALASFSHGLQQAPGDCGLLFRCANVHLILRQWSRARDVYLALLERDPCHLGALNNLGNVYVKENRLADALAMYERVAQLAPDDEVNNFNLGNVLKDMHRLDEAMQAYVRAIAVKPDFAGAQLELSHCHLMAGRFELAWPLQEWRWQTEQQKLHDLVMPGPRWLGGFELAGKSIVLWAEQGLGDTLQFVRFVPEVAARARKVWLRAPATLLPLLASLDARIELLAEDAPLPELDCHCPLTSLPLALGLTTPAQLGGTPYLAADPARVAHWQAWLAARTRPGRLRVGVTWQGKHTGGSNDTRDMPLAELEPLAACGVELVCLQKEIGADDAAWLAERPHWLRVDAELDDFGATAALVASLDLVVCVDTSIVHLTGALGKPGWLMLRHSSEWRWQFERSDSPWYPSLRLFRQQRQGQWESVVAGIAAALRARAAEV